MIDKLHRLHFWCQKVLPLVYDESLSYYELLCKVVKYLNDHTELLNTIIDFMNSFNSDVQTIVSEMAESGELDEPLKSAIYPIIGNDYSSDDNYNENDIIFHDGNLYRCVNPTTGDWVANDWEEITIADAITNLYNNLQNYVTYVTPEMFGAIGDGITDDTTAVQACFNSPIHLKMLCRSYNINSALTVINNSIITGGGSLSFSDNYGIKLDGNSNITIKDLTLNGLSGNDAVIFVTTDSGANSYCKVENCVINAHDIGLHVQRTSHYCNDFIIDRLIIWGGSIGIYIENPDTTYECNDFTILHSSAETVSDCFIKLKNTNRCTIRDCRLLEDNGQKITTEGTCYNLIIYSKTLQTPHMTFSTGTQGVIFGKIRTEDIYEQTFGGYAIITNGKIIPCKEWRTKTSNNNTNLNSNRTAPNGTKYGEDFFYSYNTSTEVTLTLDPQYYGGHGLINDVYIWMDRSTKPVTVVNGDQTFTLTSSSSGSTMHHLTFTRFAGWRVWNYVTYTKLN